MAKYLTLFNTHSRYETYNTSDSFLTPNVTYCENEVHIHYVPRYDYSQDYLTFKARETGTFSFSKSIYYSIDSGETWTSLSANTQSPTIEAGDKIMWRYANDGNSNSGIGTFSSTGEFDVQGNIMSLKVNTNDFSNTTLSTYNFYNLFQNSKVVNAKNLILPATTLATNCYNAMFKDCLSLTTAPELPATTLSNSCYYQMFNGCSSLTTAPELPATTLANYCYSYIFQNCTSLTIAPELLATTLASTCYCGMFKNCTNLTTAPELLATTLTSSCYDSMFYGCSGLTTAPELPATTLASSCYSNMFYGCTSLTTAPELPATTLAQYCYNGMFRGCSSLNYIKCLATDINASNCLNNWVNGVAATGTFVKDANMNDWTTGNNGIPTGWTVENIVIPETRLVAKYNITSTSSTTNLLYSSSNISAIEIDGVTLDSVVTSYTFSTTGEHTIKYTLIDNTIIGDDTFQACFGLTSITIPDSVTSISALAFASCPGLTSITIPDFVTSIGDSAFYGCDGLTSITIPNSVTSIGSLALSGCQGLTSITISNSITSIDSGAFFGCPNLTTLIVQATTPPTLGSDALSDTNANLVIKVPSASVNAYKAASGWSSYASKIQAI